MKANPIDYMGGKNLIQITAEHTKETYLDLKDKDGATNKSGYYFPSCDIDPELKKSQNWNCRVAEAIWSLFLRGNAYTTLDMISQIRWLRLYGTGNQPKELYMDLLLDDENRQGYLSTNWSIFSPVSKYMRVILGRMESQDYNYVATAIDPMSADKKESAMYDAWVNGVFSEQINKIKATAGVPPNTEPEYVSSSMVELEMFKNMGGFKLKEESQIEAVLDATDYISDMKTIKRKCIIDGFQLNKMAIRDYYNEHTGLCKYEYVDWENLIVDYSNETDFRDIRFWGYVKYKTINEVRLDTGLTESELIQLVQPWLGVFGNPTTGALNKYQMSGYKNENGILVYNQFRVPVLVYEYMSTDTFYNLTKNGKRYPQEWGRVYDTPTKKTSVHMVNNVYGGEWIIGSKVVYNQGLQLNQSRQNPKEPRMSLHAIALPGKSMVETIIPNLDQIQLTKLRLESAIATAKPQGLRIEIGALENIDLGDGTKNPLEIIKLARQTGDVVYRATTHSGYFNAQREPIGVSEGGIGAFFNECIQNFELNFNFIAELTGIDRISAASPKSGEQTATQTKIAAVATNDALQPLFSSFVHVKEYAAQAIVPRIQRVIRSRPQAKETYSGILGEIGAQILSIGADCGVITCGIKIEIKPTDEMVQDAKTAATEALKPGKDGESINLADWAFFMDLIRRGMIRQAQALLQFRLNQSREQNIKMQQDNMRLNGENMQKQEEAKLKSKMAEIEAKKQADIQVKAVEALLDMEVTGNAELMALKSQIIQSTLQGMQSQQPQTQPAQ